MSPTCISSDLVNFPEKRAFINPPVKKKYIKKKPKSSTKGTLNTSVLFLNICLQGFKRSLSDIGFLTFTYNKNGFIFVFVSNLRFNNDNSIKIHLSYKVSRLEILIRTFKLTPQYRGIRDLFDFWYLIMNFEYLNLAFFNIEWAF